MTPANTAAFFRLSRQPRVNFAATVFAVRNVQPHDPSAAPFAAGPRVLDLEREAQPVPSAVRVSLPNDIPGQKYSVYDESSCS